MDEHEGDERNEAAPFPEQPKETGSMMVEGSDSARESQEEEAAPSMKTEVEPESTPDLVTDSEAAAEVVATVPAEEPAPATDEPAETAATETSEVDEITSQGPADGDGSEPIEAAAMMPEAGAEAGTEAEGPTMTPVQERRAAAAEGLRRGRLPQGEVPTEGGEEPAWYVIHCYSGYENKVRHNLEQRIETMGMKDRIFDVVIPTQEEIEVKEGKRRTVERHIFPGYVLVNMTLSEESWYVVRNTPGVTGFVGMGNLPTPLRPEEVSQIIKRMESDAPSVKVSFKVGERVRIIDGPFNDFRGTVADIDVERTKVRVNVSFFGRETPVELDFLQVEKA
jgi:transcriptional antiterminator NusG